jgi:hypothetical protein
MIIHPQLVRHWLDVGGIGLGSACMLGLTALAIVVGRRPSAMIREERRRKQLTTVGRIVDGSLIDAQPLDTVPPQKIIYTYRIAGVQYQCSQDVSTLGPQVENLRLDYPVQVRYRPDNPADSIVVAETWNGLWTHIWRASGPQMPSILPQVPLQAELSSLAR